MLSACAPISFEAFDSTASLISPDAPVMSDISNGLLKSEDEKSDSETHTAKVSCKITGISSAEHGTPTKSDTSEELAIKDILNGSISEVNGDVSANDAAISAKHGNDEKTESTSEGGDAEKKAAPKRRREKHTAASICCQFVDASGAGQVCKQRAILSFQYCIRHILLDPSAPYKQCEHQRKPKSKKDTNLRCTNAVRANLDAPICYCSTHMIMNGMKEAKKKSGSAIASQIPAALQGSASCDGIEGSSVTTSALQNSHADGFAVKSPIVVATDMQPSPSMSTTPHSQLGSPIKTGPIPSVHTLVGHPNMNVPMVSQQQQVTASQFQSPISIHGPSSVPSMPMQSPLTSHVTSQPNTAPPSPAPHMTAHVHIPQQQPSTSTAMLPPQQIHLHQHPTIPHSLQQHETQQQIRQELSSQHQQMQLQRSNSRPMVQISQDVKPLHQQPSQTLVQQVQAPSSQNHQAVFVQNQQPPHVHQQLPPQQFVQHQTATLQEVPLQHQLPQQTMSQSQQPVSQPRRFPVQTISQRQIQQQQSPQTVNVVTGPAPQQQQTQMHLPVRVRQATPQTNQQSVAQPQPGPSHVVIQGPPPQAQTSQIPTTGPPQGVPQGQNPPQASSSGLMTRQHPQLAARLLDNGNPTAPKHQQRYFPQLRNHPFYDTTRNQELPFQAPPMCPPSPPEDEVGPMQGKKVIRLRQKRQKMRMIGEYRKIPMVNQMCEMLEDADFDKTDLFPLGLEPSDDEESDLGPAGCDTSLTSALPLDNGGDAATQLYLVKKQLRLERHFLLRQAQMNAPLMSLAKRCPTAAGAAMRHRQVRHRPVESSPMPMRRCSRVDNTTGRCSKPCLPMSNHCSAHVLYNVNQRLFEYCSFSGCGRSVMIVDAILWDTRCALHRPGVQPVVAVKEDRKRRQSGGVVPIATPAPPVLPIIPHVSSVLPPVLPVTCNARPVERRKAVEESHSWDDVEQFLLSEGYPVDSPGSQQTAHSTPPASVSSQPSQHP